MKLPVVFENRFQILPFFLDDNMCKNGRLMKLPKRGRALIFTDLHGDLDDYNKYLEKWDFNDPDCHIIIAGDFIHSIYKKDYSLEVLEDMIDKYKKYDNFHPILGNHEWAHIVGANVFKANINQKIDFERMIIEKRGSLDPYLSDYIDFFKSIPFFIQCENGVFVSHAGPSPKIKTYDDYKSIIEGEEYLDRSVYYVLWSRFEKDYSIEDVSRFLDIVESNVMVIGHNVISEGYEIFGRQMILSSSFGAEKKLYLDIDLERQISNTDDLIKCLKNLDE